MSFIVPSEIMIVGMFSQNGFRTIRTGADVTLVFDNDPGRLHHGKITEIVEGVGQGQIAVSGTLAKTTAIACATSEIVKNARAAVDIARAFSSF